MSDAEKGRILLRLARAAIAEKFNLATQDAPRAAWLNTPSATFVTLTLAGRARGYVGSLEARRPLKEDVQHNAVAAAFHDPLLPPLAADEFDQINIQVSLLSPITPLNFFDELDALAQLNPGEDGVILEYGSHRATLLPQAWEQLPRVQHFLTHLKRRAGLPEDFWSDDIKLSRYTVQQWQEDIPQE